jgi:hypothetical protein
MSQPYIENALTSDQSSTYTLTDPPPTLDMSTFICTFAFDSTYRIKDLRTKRIYVIVGVYQAFNRNNEISYALLPLADSPVVVATRWVTQQELLESIANSARTPASTPASTPTPTPTPLPTDPFGPAWEVIPPVESP